MSRRFLVSVLIAAVFCLPACSDDPEHLLDQAQIALDSGRPDLAAENAKRVLELDANNIRALLIRGESQLHMQQFEQSLKTIEQVLAQDGTNTDAHELASEWALRRAHHLLRSPLMPDSEVAGQFDEALARARQEAKWFNEHDKAVEAAYLLARAAQADAARLYALANDPRAEVLSPGAEPADDHANPPQPTAEQPEDTSSGEDAAKPALTPDEYRAAGDARMQEVAAHLHDAFELDPRHFSATTMYVRTLVLQEQSSDLWAVADRLAQEKELPADLVDAVIQALIHSGSPNHEVSDVVKVGSVLREAIPSESRQALGWHLSGARLLLLESKWAEARTMLRAALEVKPDDQYARAVMALCLFELGEYEEAKKLLAPLSNQLPQEAGIQSLYGRTLAVSGDVAAARTPLQAALKLNPDDAQTHLSYAQVLVHLGEMREAQPLILSYHERYPNDPHAIRMLVQLQRWRGDREAVAKILAELEKQPPEKLSEPIVAAMIDGFSFLGQYEKVEKYAAQQSQDGQSITGRIALVEALLSQGKHDEAGALLKSLAAEHGDLAAVKLLLGRWQFHAGNYAEAEPALREAVASQPQHEGARLLLARTYIGLNRVMDAIEQTEAAVTSAPNSIAARNLAVRLYLAIGRNDKVGQHLRQIELSRLDERDWPVLLAMSHLVHNRYDQALAVCNRAINRGEDDALLNLLLASVYEERNQLDPAQEQLLVYLKAQPNNAQAYQRVGSFFVRHGRQAQGITLLEPFIAENETLARLARAGLQIDINQPQAAIDELAGVLDALIAQKQPMALVAARTIAAAQVAQDQREAAVATFEKLVAAGVAVDDAMLMQVNVLAELGQEDAARAKLNALAQRVDPASQAIALEVIQRLVRIDEHDRALKLVDGWLVKQPDKPRLFIWRAELLAQLDRHTESLEAYRKAVAAEPRNVEFRRALANAYMQLHRYPEAELELIRAGEMGHAGRTESLADLGRLYLAVGLKDRARHAFEQFGQAAAQHDSRSMLALARGWLALDEPQRAYERLQPIDEAAPEYPAAQAMMAQIELSQNKVGEAGTRLRTLTQNPRTASAIIPVMLALSPDNPDHHDLIRWYDGAVALEQLPMMQRRQWMTMRFYMHLRRNDWAQSLEAAEALAAVVPDASSMQEVLFLLHVQLGQTAEAKRIYDASPPLRQTQRGALAAWLIGEAPPAGAAAPTAIARYALAMAQGDAHAARAAAEALEPNANIYRSDLLDAVDAASLSDATRLAYRRLVTALFAADVGLPQLTRQLCIEVIQSEPHAALAYGLLALIDAEAVAGERLPLGVALYASARAHRIKGEHAQAVDDLERLLLREPANVFVQYYLGQAYEGTGDIDRAIEIYRKLWDGRSPVQQSVGNDLAYLLAQHKPDRLAEAHAMATKLMQDSVTGPRRAYLLDTLGWIEHKRGKSTAALPLLQQAMPQLKDHAEAHRHIAAVYSATGQGVWADYHTRQAQAIDDAND